LQDAIIDKDGSILKSATGMEGGCVAQGSTCGVVTGGALGIARMYQQQLNPGEALSQVAVMRSVRYYVDWFSERYGSTRCFDRSGVDFNTLSGQLRYLVSIPKLFRCASQVGHAVNYLTLNSNDIISGKTFERDSFPYENSPHCAQKVLVSIRDKTGFGYSPLEQIAFVFDGGVGASGGLCGAIAGAVMALNLHHGTDLRQSSYLRNAHAFFKGHANLLVKKPFGRKDTFFLGKRLIREIQREAGSTLECSGITGETFKSLDDFSTYIQTSDGCGKRIRSISEIASKVILESM